MEECGFDLLGHGDPDFVDAVLGFDYMELLKGGAGMLSGAGGLLSGGKGGAQPSADAAAMQRMAAERAAAAESSARTWKIVGGIALGVIGLTGISLLMRKPVAA